MAKVKLCFVLLRTALLKRRHTAGLIREQMWYGENGMERLRTVKEPKQAIPTFAETIALLMEVS